MRRTIQVTVFALVAVAGCGLEPLKPLTPLGCKDLVAICRCDKQGHNCRWEFQCIPD